MHGGKKMRRHTRDRHVNKEGQSDISTSQGMAKIARKLSEGKRPGKILLHVSGVGWP